MTSLLRLIQHNRNLLPQTERVSVLGFDSCADQFKDCARQILSGRVYRTGRDFDVVENGNDVLHTNNMPAPRQQINCNAREILQ